MVVRVAVVGAGPVGLSTAVNIVERLPGGLDVTLLADKFDRDTTGHGAAGIFLPTVSGTPDHVARVWIEDSFKEYTRLLYSTDAEEAGASLTSGYFGLSRTEQIEKPVFADVIFNYRDLTERELSSLCDGKFKFGNFVTTLVLCGSKYLPWLRKRFESKGGRVQQQKVGHIKELAGTYDIVVNCTGMGSAEVTSDKGVYPVSGQVIRVKAPWVRHFYFTNEQKSSYIIPASETVVLGGTKEEYDYDTTVSQEVKSDIWRRCSEIIPSLKNAVHVEDWKGLRPYRNPTLRLEREVLSGPRGKLQVVHNYGHAADGCALSWGTAIHATQLVQEILHEMQQKTPLAKL